MSDNFRLLLVVVNSLVVVAINLEKEVSSTLNHTIVGRLVLLIFFHVVYVLQDVAAPVRDDEVKNVRSGDEEYCYSHAQEAVHAHQTQR